MRLFLNLTTFIWNFSCIFTRYWLYLDFWRTLYIYHWKRQCRKNVWLEARNRSGWCEKLPAQLSYSSHRLNRLGFICTSTTLRISNDVRSLFYLLLLSLRAIILFSHVLFFRRARRLRVTSGVPRDRSRQSPLSKWRARVLDESKMRHWRSIYRYMYIENRHFGFIMSIYKEMLKKEG